MVSTILKSGLKAVIKPSTAQIQAKRFFYPKMKSIIVRRRGPNELGVKEKILYALLFPIFVYSYPFWVLSHLDDYRKKR